MTFDSLVPGAILPGSAAVTINPDTSAISVPITNTSDVPIHLTAHFHVFEANPHLRFDRRRAWGMRPDVAAGSAVRIPAGETIEVLLVPIGGKRIVYGFAGMVEGMLDNMSLEEALAAAIARGYQHMDSEAS